MVYITKLPTFLSLVVLATTFSSSLVESASGSNKMDCGGKTSKNTVFSSKSDNEYIVMLKSESSGMHIKWLKDCWDIDTKSVSKNDYSSIISLKNTAIFFSAEGSDFSGYHGKFSDEFITSQVANNSAVKYIEKNAKVKINYAVPSQNELFKRTTDNDPEPNDDRIDQTNPKLDGKFTFPDSAGKGVDIFVVDTGLNINHEEFEDRAKFGGSFCDGCNDEDENGHGTHVSSIAAGKTLGVARKANVIGVRVLDAKGAGSNADVIEGLMFVLGQHTSGKSKNTVVNMSLGGGKSQAVNDAVKSLTDAGVHVAVAAGNDSEDACKSSPASEPSAITVAAIENDRDDITDFSSIGKCVDICAPGRDITGADAKNVKDTVVFSGTSQATPHVAGTIALVIAEYGNSSPDEMAKTLNDLSTKDKINKDTLKGTPNRLLKVPENKK